LKKIKIIAEIGVNHNGKISLAKPYIYISEKYNVEWENFRFIDFILINKDIKNHETANFLLKNSSFI